MESWCYAKPGVSELQGLMIINTAVLAIVTFSPLDNHTVVGMFFLHVLPRMTKSFYVHRSITSQSIKEDWTGIRHEEQVETSPPSFFPALGLLFYGLSAAQGIFSLYSCQKYER